MILHCFVLLLGLTILEGCSNPSNAPLNIAKVVDIESKAKTLVKQNKDVFNYIDSLTNETKNENLSLILNVLSLKYNEKLTNSIKLEKYKNLATKAFNNNLDPGCKFIVRKEIASVLLSDQNTNQGINQMLMGIGEIESQPAKYSCLLVKGYSKLAGAKFLSIEEKEQFTELSLKYTHASDFSKLASFHHNLGYFQFEMKNIESAIHHFRKSIKIVEDIKHNDTIEVQNYRKRRFNFEWSNTYPSLMACYTKYPDTIYHYIQKIDQLHKDKSITESTYNTFKLHALPSIIEIGDYQLSQKYIDEISSIYKDTCGHAYLLVLLYKSNAILQDRLDKTEEQLVSLKKWYKFSCCDRIGYFFRDNKFQALDEILKYFKKHNNLKEIAKYQKIKQDLLAIQLLEIKRQNKSSKTWSIFELEVEKSRDKYHKAVLSMKQRRYYILLGATAFVTLLFFYIFRLNRSLKASQKENLEKQHSLNKANSLLETKNNIILNQNQNLNQQKSEIEVRLKDKLLLINSLNENTNNITEYIDQIEKENKISLYQLKNKLNRIVDENASKEAFLQFQEFHSDFVQKLCKSHPNLTSSNIKLCILLKLNMSSKEIAVVEGKTTESVKVARSRLRKKLHIKDKEISLSAYFNNPKYNKT